VKAAALLIACLASVFVSVASVPDLAAIERSRVVAAADRPGVLGSA
jgi:hypothetical protein